MAWIWRENARRALALYILLDILLVVDARTAGARINAGNGIGQQLVWYIPEFFLVWRVWRGGRLSWAVLLLYNGLCLLIFAFPALITVFTGPPDPYFIGLFALTVIQLILLLSPAVRHRLT